MTTRRNVLLGGGIFVAFGAAQLWRTSGGNPDTNYEITRTPEEWRSILSDQEFNILRQAGTEQPFTSPLNDENRSGVFSCAGCQLENYESKAKYESGTGWPSFTASLDNAIVKQSDRKLLIERTEVLCRRCGSHLGHVFDDGPAPTGKRHCLNGLALRFSAST